MIENNKLALEIGDCCKNFRQELAENSYTGKKVSIGIPRPFQRMRKAIKTAIAVKY